MRFADVFIPYVIAAAMQVVIYLAGIGYFGAFRASHCPQHNGLDLQRCRPPAGRGSALATRMFNPDCHLRNTEATRRLLNDPHVAATYLDAIFTGQR